MFYRLIVVAALTLVPQTQALEYIIKTSGTCEVELTENQCRQASAELFSLEADINNRVVRNPQTITYSRASKCSYSYSSTMIASYTTYSTAETSGSCGSSTKVCVCGIPDAEVRDPTREEIEAILETAPQWNDAAVLADQYRSLTSQCTSFGD